MPLTRRDLLAAVLTVAALLVPQASPARSASADVLAPTHVADVDVVAVADGDTVHVLLDGVRTRVRLSRIDAPEHRQAFGQRSEQSLRELVWKKRARMHWSERDRHGRPIVTLIVDGQDASVEQVRRGFAWVYRAYSQDAELLRLEQEARAARRGLWADADPVPPWEWRKSHPRGAPVE